MFALIIYFIRHAKAIDKNSSGFKKSNDLDRPLTKQGIKEFTKLLKTVKNQINDPKVIYYSPALRTASTAEIITDYFKIKTTKLERLLPESSTIDFLKWFKDSDFDENIIFVGHEPNLSSIISKMLNASPESIKMKKGAIAAVEIKNDHLKQLLWLIGPDFSH
jgi:phosphohistidine phosphatase